MHGAPARGYGDELPLNGRARFQLFALAAGAATVAALVADAVAGARRRETRIELQIGIDNGLAAPQSARPEEAAPRLEHSNGKPVAGPAAATGPASTLPTPARSVPPPALSPVLRYPGPSTSLVPLRNGRAYGWPTPAKTDGWAADGSPQLEPVLLQAAPAGAPPVEPPPPSPETRPQLPPPQPPGAAPPTTGGSSRSLKTTKRILVLAMLAGIAVYAGGGGVFGSFSAETSNVGSTAASGTLTMSDTVNSGTACASISGTKNVNSSCGAILTLANLAPGVFPAGGTATVTVQNTGSIDASKLWLWAPPNSTTLSSALSTGAAITSLPVSKLDSNVASGQSIVVSSGGNSQTFVASGTATASTSATSIPVTSLTPNFAYPSGAAVNVVDCLDSQTTTSTVSGATVGTGLGGFNPIAGNPFCGAVLLYVQEITGTVSGTPGSHNYCWSGATYSSGFAGACKAPINVTTTQSITANTTLTNATLSVNALNGNVASGDTISVTDGTNTDTLTAGANAYIGATSITVSGTPTHSYTTGATVTDTTTLGSLNSDTTDTLTNFDTLHNGSQGPIELKTVTANGTLQSSGVVDELPTGTSAARKFQIGVYFPQPAGTNQNALQGLSSAFGMTWHIDQ